MLYKVIFSEFITLIPFSSVIVTVLFKTLFKCYIILIQMHAVLEFAVYRLTSAYYHLLVVKKCYVFLKSIKILVVRLYCLLNFH